MLMISLGGLSYIGPTASRSTVHHASRRGKVDRDIAGFLALLDDCTKYQDCYVALQTAIRHGDPEDAACYAMRLVRLGEFILNQISDYPGYPIGCRPYGEV